jgi:hypothetical protein
MLTEVLINSNPLAEEFTDLNLLLLLELAKCFDQGLIQESFGICQQELSCMLA